MKIGIKILLIRLFKFFPECSFKNKIWYLYQNYIGGNDFKIYYQKKYILVVFKDFSIKFYNRSISCFNIIFPLRGYLKKYMIKNGDIVIDAGAYIGIFTLVASKIVGNNGKIIAFEPDIGNYKNLIDNIRLNNITNIVAINKGLWSKDTTLKFNSTHTEESSFFLDYADVGISVPVVSLDDELERLNIDKINFIKMDIEGAEICAVKGGKKTLKNNDVKLSIASYHIVDGCETHFEIERLLGELGYRTETLTPEHLVTYAYKIKECEIPRKEGT